MWFLCLCVSMGVGRVEEAHPSFCLHLLFITFTSQVFYKSSVSVLSTGGPLLCVPEDVLLAGPWEVSRQGPCTFGLPRSPWAGKSICPSCGGAGKGPVS